MSTLERNGYNLKEVIENKQFLNIAKKIEVKVSFNH